MADLVEATGSTTRVSPSMAALARAVVAARLGAGPMPSANGDAEAAVVDFVELFVIDPHAVTDEIAAAVVGHLGEVGAAALTTIVAVEEARLRARITLETLTTVEVP